MRTRLYKRPASSQETSKPSNFQYISQSDDNGPVTFGSFSHQKPNGEETKVRYKMAKPYYMVGSNYSSSTRPFGLVPSAINYNILRHFLHYDDLALRDLTPIQPAVNFAMTNALETGKLLLAVSLVEMKQTRSLLAGAFLRYYNLIFDLYKSAKRLKPYDMYELISNTYLEVRYGWTPLFGELTNLFDLITKKDEPVLLSKSGLQAYPDINYLHDIGTIDFGIKDEDGVNRQYVFTGTLRIKSVNVKAGFNYVNRVGSRNDSLMAELGLDIDSIGNTVWELIPFSFILDMFVKTGDLLGVESFDTDVAPFNGYVTRTYDYEINGVVSLFNEPLQHIPPAVFLFAGLEPQYMDRQENFVQTKWAQAKYRDANDNTVNNYQRYLILPSFDDIPETDVHTSQSDLDRNNQAYGTNYSSHFCIVPKFAGSNKGQLAIVGHFNYQTWITPGGVVEAQHGVAYDQLLNKQLANRYLVAYDAEAGGVASLKLFSRGFFDYDNNRVYPDPPLLFHQWLNRFHPEAPPTIFVGGPPFIHDDGIQTNGLYFGLIDGKTNSISSADHSYFRFRDTVLGPSPPEEFNYSSSGFSVERELFADFVYEQLFSTDLSALQVADLAIFAERLTTGIIKTIKK